MAAQAAVVLTDAAGTPVNRQFDPQGIDEKRVVWWRYLADGTVAAYEWLSLYLRDVTPQSDAHKVSWKLEVPVLETVSTTGTAAGYTAGPKVAYTMIANLEFVLPSRCSLQDRKDLKAMITDLVNTETVFRDSIWNLDMPY